MARDKSPKIRQLAQLERKLNRRASYDRVLIVSEGSKTEPLYFKEIKKALRLQTANVEVHPSELGTEPIQVVRYAQQLPGSSPAVGTKILISSFLCKSLFHLSVMVYAGWVFW